MLEARFANSVFWPNWERPVAGQTLGDSAMPAALDLGPMLLEQAGVNADLNLTHPAEVNLTHPGPWSRWMPGPSQAAFLPLAAT